MYNKTIVQAAGSIAGTVAVAAILAIAPVAPASAADSKGISATECQPFLPTTYSTAIFKDNAVHNPTASNQRVICPVNKDAFVDWEAGNVTLQAYIKAGATPGKVSCTLYGGGSSFGGAQAAYTATSATLAAGVQDVIDIPGIADPAVPLMIEGWNVLCTLNAGMSLGGFYFQEDYDTGLDSAP